MNVVLILFCLIFFFSLFKWLYPRLSRERPDRRYKDLFGLNKNECKQLSELLPLIKEHFTLDFCIEETIRFYVHIFRELPVDEQKSATLNRQLVEYGIYWIKNKYDFKPVPTHQELSLRENLGSEEIALVEKYAGLITPLTDKEEEKLFLYDNKRWKRKYDELTLTYEMNQPDVFYEKITSLTALNKSVRLMDTRNLFYKGYLFMAQHHKETSLKLYLQYLHVKSASDTFQYKQISARNVSKLFGSKEQKEKFDAICKRFQKDDKLEKALAEVSTLCAPVRKKITLNVDSIQEAKEKQTKVAQLLSTYLDDEPAAEISETNMNAEKQQEIAGDNQKELFHLFIANAFRLNQQEVHIFAQSKGLFKDQFIESINDQFYETLDDLLIEEDEEEYILNEKYYKIVDSSL